VSPLPALPAFALGAAGFSYVLALAAWRRGRPGLAAGLFVAAGLGLRLYASGDDYLHAWDERFHALVAKNLMAHPLRPTLYDTPLLPYDYRDWQEAEVWLHKPTLRVARDSAWHLVGGRLPSLLASLFVTVHPVY
jgi:4-amino-4-deoxy-L-arabinose transferase